MNRDQQASIPCVKRHTRSAMNFFTTFRRSRPHLFSALVVALVMAGAAVAQQVCPIPPVAPDPPILGAPGTGSLQGVPVPLPQALDTVVKNRPKAIALGKALFWDKQAGSDGQACASCHFHAGADNRSKNQLNPALRAVPPDAGFQPTRTGSGGPNYQLKAGDYPFHVLTDPLDRNSAIIFDSNDTTSSQGAFSGTFGQFFGLNNEACSLETQGIFHVNGKLTRKVEPRNTPTMINAIFQFRSFWDGRANNRFNGVNPFGRRDSNARILERQGDGSIAPAVLDLENAALASQAVGPTTNDTEMSCANRQFKMVGRKLLTQIPRPLFGQKVELDDSALGPYADVGHGLKPGVTYPALIQEAFQDKYWLAPGYASPDGYTLMEENFSMFWGLAIMMYESTLVSDQSPFDGFVGTVAVTTSGIGPNAVGIVNTATQPNFGALTPQQVNGMVLFMGKGKCVACHKGPDFTGAGLNLQFTQKINQESVIERMFMGDNGLAIYDNGFYNIGAAPTNQDLGVGADDPFGHPLSFARQLKQLVAGQIVPDPFLVNPCFFEANPCVPVQDATIRDAVDGAMKTPGLRNVELTGPYMHNGSMATLEEVVEFYNRGGNRRGPISSDTTGFDHSPQWGNNPSNLDVDVQPLGLTAQEQADLVAFMKSLTDERVRCEKAPFDHPALANFNGHADLDRNNDGKLDDLILRLPSVGGGGRPAKGLACLKAFHETLP
ncbi:MAG: cytochrome-c peroxidase [Nitrospira sp.]|nr:MAG: cytochrome-c peroxidase [Nitrospira sp.]